MATIRPWQQVLGFVSIAVTAFAFIFDWSPVVKCFGPFWAVYFLYMLPQGQAHPNYRPLSWGESMRLARVIALGGAVALAGHFAILAIGGTVIWSAVLFPLAIGLPVSLVMARILESRRNGATPA